MKELKEVFGRVEAPAIGAAEILEKKDEELQEMKLQDDHGHVISLFDIELRMNEGARSLISLGLIAGDRIAISGLSYEDALFIYLAAEQIGVNVVHLSDENSVDAQLSELQPRLTIVGGHSDVGLNSEVGEYLITQGELQTIDDRLIAWSTFLNLKAYCTDWELERFRVVAA